MNKRIPAAVLAALLCISCAPALSGCNASVDYELKTDDSGKKYYVAKCSGYSAGLDGEYEIHEYYGEGENRAPVTEIASGGFSVTGLTKITVPKTVTKIGVAAFSNNNYLREVVFAEGINLEVIERGTFGECLSLQTIEIPSSVKTIEKYAFYDCSKLESISLPSVEVIGSNAFYGCTKLAEVNLSESLTTIGEMSFCNTGLTGIIIPDSVHDIKLPDLDESGAQKRDEEGNLLYTTTYGIGFGAFLNCNLLKLAVVGKGVQTITSGAFSECSSLETVYLPASLIEIQGAYFSDSAKKYIYGHAFYKAPLKDLFFEGTEQQWEELKKHIDNKEAYQNGKTSDNSALFNANLIFNKTYTK